MMQYLGNAKIANVIPIDIVFIEMSNSALVFGTKLINKIVVSLIKFLRITAL
jgi:hypothetical protein